MADKEKERLSRDSQFDRGGGVFRCPTATPGVSGTWLQLDFHKIFDRVPHDFFINKLERCRLGGVTVRWMHKWVSINRTISEYQEISNGIPQESVLGQILVNICIHDLDAGAESFLVRFAHDT